MSAEFWRGKRVFLTGHTGFKGSWLSLMLQSRGAHVTGYALAPLSDRDLFVVADVACAMHSVTADVRDLPSVTSALTASAPDIVIHMAAQALVAKSYADPIGTYTTNVIGTINVLEALRRIPSVRVAIIVTSDKCYANGESEQRFRESDALGGSDPYSSSKACAELATKAYARSFFGAGPVVATARAGNVIGGGDWAADRLVPDLVRGALVGKPTAVRNPAAIRPWQHVLDPLAGYLTLAERLSAPNASLARSFNFGPDAQSEVPVATIADKFCKLWGGAASWVAVPDKALPEAGLLRLDSVLARESLGWKPRWSLSNALEATVEWYRDCSLCGADARALCLRQIADHATATDSAALMLAD